MTGAWGLPMQAEAGRRAAYAIRSDYRDVLELLRWLNGQADPALDQSRAVVRGDADCSTRNLTRMTQDALAGGNAAF